MGGRRSVPLRPASPDQRHRCAEGPGQGARSAAVSLGRAATRGPASSRRSARASSISSRVITSPPASSPSVGGARCASPGTPTSVTSVPKPSPPARSPTGRPGTTTTARPLNVMSKLGTFAEYGVVHEASLVKVGREFPLPAVALVSCGVTTGWGSAVYRAEVEPGDTVVVVGVGGVGMNAVQGAHMAGARYVVAVDPGGVQAEVGPRLRRHPHGRVDGRGAPPRRRPDPGPAGRRGDPGAERDVRRT